MLRAAGTYGFVLDGDALVRPNNARATPLPEYNRHIPFRPPHGTPLLVKVMTDEAEFRKEMDEAVYLSQQDPRQEMFLYPFQAFRIPADAHLLTQAASTFPILRHHLDTDAKHMYAMLMVDGGLSLHVWQHERDEKWEETHVLQALDNLLDGVLYLSRHGLVNPDLHAHNAVLRKTDDGRAVARWIDMSKIERKDTATATLKNAPAAMDALLAVVRLAHKKTPQLQEILQQIQRAKTQGLYAVKASLQSTPKKRPLPRDTSGSPQSPPRTLRTLRKALFGGGAGPRKPRTDRV